MIFDDEFEWDELKNLSNQEKHGFSFEEARLIWDSDILTYQDRRPYSETRYISVGILDSRTILFVVYTWRGQRKHLISAREAEPYEATKYITRYLNRRRR